MLRRHRREANPTVEAVPLTLPRWLPAWQRLDAAERTELAEMSAGFIDEIRFEAANGFVVTDEMRIVVAGHAALLVLHIDDGIASYSDVTSVILHPSTIVRHGSQPSAVAGWQTTAPDPLLGEAHHRGPVLVAWDAARFQARNPHIGENVLLHEFAHRLDMLDGLSDGTPPLPDAGSLQRWVEVCSEVYERVRHDDHPVLRAYAATNPAEFFAVATEVYFTRGAALAATEPALYDVLHAYYRQNTAG